MLQKLLDYFILYTAFTTPYPYYAMLAIAMMLLVMCGIFWKIRNGALGYILFFLALIGVIGGFFCIKEKQTEKIDERHRTRANVLFVSGEGIRLETGELIVPAGIQMLQKGQRGYRAMVREAEDVINNEPVDVEWSEDMEGYCVYSSSGKDIGYHLVSKGLSKAGSLASSSISNAERDAKSKRLGYWKLEFGYHDRDPFLDAAFAMIHGYILLFTVFIVVLASAWMTEHIVGRIEV